MSAPVLPDCVRCGGTVVLDLDGDGPAEVCQRCGLAQKPIPPKVNRAQIREQVRHVRRLRPLLCPSCLGRRCRSCQVMTCECPGNHPRRPAGDVHPEAMALLAGERHGHLDPTDVPEGVS